MNFLFLTKFYLHNQTLENQKKKKDFQNSISAFKTNPKFNCVLKIRDFKYNNVPKNSTSSKSIISVMAHTGHEPVTFALLARRSNQLS